MDKGLIKINELKRRIKDLQTTESQNAKKIADLIKEYSNLEYEIYDLDEMNINLNNDKRKAEEEPQKRKQDKKNLIISFILAYIVTSLICTLVIGIGSGGAVSVLKCLGTSSLGMLFVSSIAIPIEFKNINKKYPIGNLQAINNNILENNTKLELLNSKKLELNESLTNLQEVRNNLESEIGDLQKEIDCIASIRTMIIEEFCKDNPALDKKLDNAYENEIQNKEKEKVK